MSHQTSTLRPAEAVSAPPLQRSAMSQAAFLFDTPAAAPGASPAALRSPSRPQRPAGTDHTAFEIGWDFAHYRLTPPVAHLHADNPVRQGWSAGRAGFGSRTLRPSPAVRRW